MIGGRRHIHLILGVGIVIGSVLGFGVGGALGPFLARSRESAPAGVGEGGREIPDADRGGVHPDGLRARRDDAKSTDR
jgi:hypothetical protein